MQTDAKLTHVIQLPRFGRVAIVAARWHDDVVSKLIEGARAALAKAAPHWTSDLFFAPGSYELPQLAYAIAKSERYQAVVPLGCLVRGDTSHFEWISQAVFHGLDQVGRETRVAVANGVLTVETKEQALARAGGAAGNKGEEAMMAALELFSVMEAFQHD